MTPLPILHLEDDENDRLFLEVAFQTVGIAHPLQQVPDGQVAIDYLSGTGNFADRARFPLPLLTILDLKTPRKTGLDVLRWIRAQTQFAGMPVIMLTASANYADLDAAYGAGASAFLVKPAGIDILTEMARAIQQFWLVHNRYPGERL